MSPRISRKRLVAAFLVAPLVPVVVNALMLWPVFTIALVVGLVSAYALAILVGVPFVLILQARGALSFWRVVAVAGLLAVVPDLSITLLGFGDFGTLNQWGISLIRDRELTLAGFAWFFVLRPAAYWLIGAIGGIVFWFVATGVPSNTGVQPTPASGRG